MDDEKKRVGTIEVETPEQHRWLAALHESAHLVALWYRLNLVGRAVLVGDGGGLSTGLAHAATFGRALFFAAGEQGERLAAKCRPPGTAPDPAPPGELSANASVAAREWFHTADVSDLRDDDLPVRAWAVRGPDPERWAFRYHRVRRTALALVLRHRDDVLELAARLYETGEVSTAAYFEEEGVTIITESGKRRRVRAPNP